MGDTPPRSFAPSDRDSTEQLLPLVYDELKQIANSKMANERPDHTLQATALVHEVYCRLSERTDQQAWNGADHFLAAASEAMRRILVDHARRKLATKRGGNHLRMSLDGLSVELPLEPTDLLAIHEALDDLAEEDRLAADVVNLRVFGGFNHAQVAELLHLTDKKVSRIWAYAKARLYNLIAEAQESR